MNLQISTPAPTSMDQMGAHITKRLSAGLDDLPHDITERLRAGRMRAIAARQRDVVRAQQVATEISVSGGVASLHADEPMQRLWQRLGAIVPLLALVVGLVTIALIQEDNRIREVAEVDAELLTDELPPSAYVDPGFAQFVSSNRSN